MTPQLDIKVRALVLGMREIQDLAARLGVLKKEVGYLSDASKAAGPGLDSLGSASKSAGGLAGELSKHLADIKKNADVAKSGLNDLDSTMDAAGGGMKTLARYAVAAASAFLAFTALKGVKDLADYSARTETLGVTLGVVGRNAGYSKQEIDLFESSLKKLGITTQSAREGMTAMIQAGLPLGVQAGQSSSNVERLARAAQDLAVVTGENSSDTFRRMITNIQQMDTLGLRFMGLNVDIGAAQEKFASSIGKSAGALTQQQKILAVNNAVLAESMKLQGAYELSMETVGKKVASLKRYQEELADSMGKKLLPAYNVVVEGATNLLKSLKEVSDQTDKSGEASKRLGEAIAPLINQLSDLTVAAAEAVGGNSKGFTTLVGNLIGMVTDLTEVASQIVQSANKFGVVGDALDLVNFIVAALRDGLRFLGAGAQQLAGVMVATAGLIVRGWGNLASLIGLDSLAEKMFKVSDDLENMGRSSIVAGSQVVKDFSAGRSAVNSFIEGVDNSSVALANFGKSSNVEGITAEFENLAVVASKYGSGSEEMKTATEKSTQKLAEMAKTGRVTAVQIDGIIAASKEAGVQLPQGFGSGAEVLKNLAEAAEKARAELLKMGSASTGVGLLSEINSLVAGQRTLALSGGEVRIGYDKLTESLEKFKASGGDQKQVAEATKMLGVVATGMANSMQNSLKTLDVSVQELATGVSPKFAELSGGLANLAQEGQATADQFQAAFNLRIDTAKSVAEVNSLTMALDEAGKRSSTLVEASAAQAKVVDEAYSAAISAAEVYAQREEEAAKIVKDSKLQVGDAAVQASVREALAASETAEAVMVAAKKTVEAERSKLSTLKDSGAQWLSASKEAAQIAAAQFDKVFDVSVKSAKTEAAFNTLQQNVVEFGVKSGQSLDWVTSKLEYISIVATRTGQDIKNSAINEALKEIGLTVEEINGKASRSSEDMAQGLRVLAREAAVSGDAYYKAFVKAVDSSKSINDLAAFKDSLRETLESGKIEWSEYSSALQVVGNKFDKLFQASLKSANTKEAMSQLVSEVSKLGEEGAISAKQLSMALQEIANKASGGSAEVARLAEQAAQMAAKSADIANANKEILTASLGVQQAKNELLKAENIHRQRGTDLSRAEVEAANASLRAAEAKQEVAQATADLKAGEYALAQAEADLVNAKLTLEKDGSDANRAAVLSAEQHKNEVAATVSNLKSAVSAAQELAAAEEGAAAAAKSAAESIASTASTSFRSPDATYAITSLDEVRQSFKEAGRSIKEASAEADLWYEKLKLGPAKIRTGTESEVYRMVRLHQEYNKLLEEGREKVKKLEYEESLAAEWAGQIKKEFEDTVTQQSALINGTSAWAAGADAVSKAYAEIKQQAFDVSKSAVESARSFVTSSLSIHEELLQAQGLEDAAARSRFATRRKELEIQYRQLEIQIKLAQVQAKAAGIGTTDLDAMAAEASRSFYQAQAELRILEQMEISKIRKTAEEKRVQDKKDKLSKVEDKPVANLRSQLGEVALGSYAGPTSAVKEAGQKAVDELRPKEIVKIVLEMGKKNADIYVPAGEKDDLLDLLTSLKERSM